MFSQNEFPATPKSPTVRVLVVHLRMHRAIILQARIGTQHILCVVERLFNGDDPVLEQLKMRWFTQVEYPGSALR